MILLVVGTTVAATAMTAVGLAWNVRQQHREELRRIIQTLRESTFPLTRAVLKQMEGLSGTSFVLVNREGNLLESTVDAPIDTAFLRDAIRNPARSADSESIVTIAGVRYLVDSTPIEDRGTSTGDDVVLLLRLQEDLTNRIYEAIYPAIAIGALATIVASAIATLLARRFVRPIQDLVQHAALIAQGDFAATRQSQRTDELGDLTNSINAMSQRLKDFASQLRSVERMETLTQIGMALAHQLRNSAAGGRMAIELHRRECGSANDEALSVALRQLQLMESYLRQFLSVGGRKSPPIKEPLDLRLLVSASIALVQPMAEHASIDLKSRFGNAPVMIAANDESLRQLVTNLVINGIEALSLSHSQDRRILVSVDRIDEDHGRLVVADTGDGPTKEMTDLMFEPLMTNKADGIGLGLFVARQIAENHGGSLSYKREIGETTFCFEFPTVKGV